YKHFIPMQKKRNTLGYNLQASFLTGYGGVVAPPFQRFYMGGENDLRGFDIRSVSPVAFLPNTSAVVLRNPDGSAVPKDPSNPLLGAYTIRVPAEQIVFPGGDLSLVGNLEYRFTIAGPVALAPFVDFGVDPILRSSQLRINSGQLTDINTTVFGCPQLDVALNCIGGHTEKFSPNLQLIGSTNWVPRMSTGLELQVFLPVINAPFRVYWAYNPMRLNSSARGPAQITRDMFPCPPGTSPPECQLKDAGDFTFQETLRSFSPLFQLREPRKTFRFTVATTF
ncbi:MAG: outer membrane protein assembly factor BamA, partial [Acidobacteria bacterium]